MKTLLPILLLALTLPHADGQDADPAAILLLETLLRQTLTSRLREQTGITVVGIWERGTYTPPAPHIPFDASLLQEGTNVVAIILGAAATFYAGGIRERSVATGSQRRPSTVIGRRPVASSMACS